MARKKTKAIDKLQENVFELGYLEPTPGLNAREVEIFNTIVQSMKPGFFIDGDRLLLGEYVKLQQISDLAFKELQESDTFLTTANTGVQMSNKLIDVIVKTSSAMGTISQKLGVCPSARQKHTNKTNVPGEAVDPMGDLLD